MKQSYINKQIIILLLSILSIQLNAQTNITFPVADEWKAKTQMPAISGDGFSIQFTGAVAVDSLAPIVGEWNRTAEPDETITLSGTRFTMRTGTKMGSDTRAYIYAQTPAGGVVKPCKILYVNDLLMTVTLPADIPYGLYFIWIKNEKGISAPIVINKAIAKWIGPLGNSIQAGAKKRIFGKNLSFERVESSSKVFIQPASGGAFTECVISHVEPYSVEFQVPEGTANGNYKVFLHSGHGGEYGWSEGVDLIVEPQWVRGTAIINVLPGENIQNAVDQITALPNGGTVKLLKGLHTVISDTLNIHSKVNLEGIHRDSTILQLKRIFLTNAEGNHHLAMQNMTVRPHAAQNCNVTSQAIKGGAVNNDVLFKNVFFDVHPYPADSTSKMGTFFEINRFEVTNCEFNGKLSFNGTDIWIHNNRLNGGRAEQDGSMTYTDGKHFNMGERILIENNDAGTLNWPNKNGNRNYTEFLTSDQRSRLIWSSRLIYFQVGHTSVDNVYIARNKTTDCAIQANKGEQILFHSNYGQFAQVNKSQGKTIEVRTDGKIYGSNVPFYINSKSSGVSAFTSVPDKLIYGETIDDRAYAIIINGKGKGQFSKVKSHTSTTVTVENEWRVQPDTTSVILLSLTTQNAVVYKNDLSGFPEGYRYLSAAASYGVNTESAINASVEQNVSDRTMYGHSIQGYDLAPSIWNEARNNKSTNTYLNGSRIVARTGDWNSISIRTVSPVVIGSWIRNDESESLGGSDMIGLGRGDTQSNMTLMQASGIENSVFKKGTVVAGNSEGLIYRNNILNGTSATLKKYSNAIFSNNGTGTFAASTNLFKDKIIPEYRALDFSTDNVDAEIEVPILNGGVNSWVFSVLSASQPWIIASVKDGTSTIAQESNSGKVLVRIDKTQLPAGNQQGIITLTNVNGLQNTIGVFYNDPNATSVKQIEDKSISMYPSPFDNYINLKGNDIKGYAIYDMSGQMLLSQKTTSELVLIDTQSLTQGAYLIKIETSKGVLYRKAVK